MSAKNSDTKRYRFNHWKEYNRYFHETQRYRIEFCKWLVLQQTVQAEDGTARSRLRECIWITGYVEEFFEERDTVRHLAWKFAEDRRPLFDR